MHVEARIPEPDEFYAKLVALHADLSPEQSLRLMSKLVLLLANQVGDPATLDEVLKAAAGSAHAQE